MQLVKELVELGLNSINIVLREKLEQLIIRDEVQPGELCTLLIKVLLYFLLYVFHFTIVALKLLESCDGAVSFNKAPGRYFLHEASPGLVDAVELFVLFVALLLDLLRRGKDVLQVKPVPLEDFPLLDGIRDSDQQSVLPLDLFLESLHVSAALDITDIR